MSKGNAYSGAFLSENFVYRPVMKCNPVEIFDSFNATVSQHMVEKPTDSFEALKEMIEQKKLDMKNRKSAHFSMRHRKTKLFAGCVDIYPSDTSIKICFWTTKSQWLQENILEILERLILFTEKYFDGKKLRIGIPCAETYFTNLIINTFNARKGHYRQAQSTPIGMIMYHEYYFPND